MIDCVRDMTVSCSWPSLSCSTSAPAKVEIRGERHSGTNLLEALLNLNFQLRIRNPTPEVGESFNARVGLYHKHMFFAASPTQEDAMLAALSQTQTLVLVVREPVRWLVAMHRQPHHSEWLNRLPFDTFLRTGWTSTMLPGLPRSGHPLCGQPGILNALSRRRDATTNATPGDACVGSERVDFKLGVVTKRRDSPPYRRAMRCGCARARPRGEPWWGVPAFDSVLHMRRAKLALMRRAYLQRSARGGGVALVRYEELASDAARALCGLANLVPLCPVAASSSAPQLLGERVDPGTGAHSPHSAARHDRPSAKRRGLNPSLGQSATRPTRRASVPHRSLTAFVATTWSDSEERWHYAASAATMSNISAEARSFIAGALDWELEAWCGYDRWS